MITTIFRTEDFTKFGIESLGVRTFYRGTTEEWERMRMNKMEGAILAAGKEYVKNNQRWDIWTEDENLINQEIINRVGKETYIGTPNYDSFFVPCTNIKAMAAGFGHGSCFEFIIPCVLYGKGLDQIRKFVTDRENFNISIAPGIKRDLVAMFEGGPNEWLAFSGSPIFRVKVVA